MIKWGFDSFGKTATAFMAVVNSSIAKIGKAKQKGSLVEWTREQKTLLRAMGRNPDETGSSTIL